MQGTLTFTWGTSSSDPMSGIELRRVPVGYTEPIIMMGPSANEGIPLIRETGKMAGQSEIILYQIIDRKISQTIYGRAKHRPGIADGISRQAAYNRG